MNEIDVLTRQRDTAIDALDDLVEALKYTPIGVRALVALSEAIKILADLGGGRAVSTGVYPVGTVPVSDKG